MYFLGEQLHMRRILDQLGTFTRWENPEGRHWEPPELEDVGGILGVEQKVSPPWPKQRFAFLPNVL